MSFLFIRTRILEFKVNSFDFGKTRRKWRVFTLSVLAIVVAQFWIQNCILLQFPMYSRYDHFWEVRKGCANNCLQILAFKRYFYSILKTSSKKRPVYRYTEYKTASCKMSLYTKTPVLSCAFIRMLIKFLLHSSLVKSDSEIGKFSYQDMVCLRRTRQRMLESFYGPLELTLVSWVFRMRYKQCGS